MIKDAQIQNGMGNKTKGYTRKATPNYRAILRGAVKNN